MAVRIALKLFVRIKGKFHPITEHKRTEKEYKYIYTLSLTSALDGEGLTPRPAALPPAESSSASCSERWAGPGAKMARRGEE